MRITTFIALPFALASFATASVGNTFSGAADTIVYITGSEKPLVVQGGGTAISATGTTQGVNASSTTGSAVYASSSKGYGVQAISDSGGAGLYAEGLYYGISTVATDGFGEGVGINASGYHGVRGYGSYTYGEPVGVFGQASGGSEPVGVYGTASGGSTDNWAGKFNGKVYSSIGFTASDLKLKKNVEPLSQSLQKVMALKPRQYEMKVDEYKGKVSLPEGLQFGLIAQEVESVFPHLVQDVSMPADLTAEERKKNITKEPTHFKSVNYTALIPVLIQAIQEQQAEIEALKRGQGR